MTIQVHITFEADDKRIVEADCEVSYKSDGDALYIDEFYFADVAATDSDHETQLFNEMPAEYLAQAEEEAERLATQVLEERA